MPHLNSGSVRRRLESIGLPRLLLFLDFDETLAPIAARPERVRLKKTVRRWLDRLGRRLPIVIVSGRSVNDLRRLIDLRHLRYIGQHGFSYVAPGKAPTWLAPRPPRHTVRKWKQALDTVAETVDGAWVEDKAVSVALHDRQVAAGARSRLRRRAVAALQHWLREKQIRLLAGKHVMEVLPANPLRQGNRRVTSPSRALGQVSCPGVSGG